MKQLIALITLLTLFGCGSAKTVDLKKLPKDLGKSAWRAAQSFSAPESTYYSKRLNLIFVSNINGKPIEKNKKGYISLLTPNGKLVATEWVKGLNAPKGMVAFNSTLWVSDIDQVVGININNGQIKTRIDIPGSKFLNDLAVDEAGNVYVSDLFTGKIHKIEGKNSSVWMEGSELENPNGLYFHNRHLYVAAWGPDINPNDFSTSANGRFYKINMETKKITYLTDRLGQLDGLERTINGDFIISDWVRGSVYKISEKGQVTLIYEGSQGTADIGYIARKGLITIPKMMEGKVEAIKL